jgi:hypothetical protein
MGKKYLETKEKSLESSVLGIWQEAAKKEDELEEAKFSPKEIKMAIGVASDKRYAGGNMTGAVKAIDKIKKGLSGHPQVAAVLKRQNENITEARGDGFLRLTFNSPADVKKVEKWISDNLGDSNPGFMGMYREGQKAIAFEDVGDAEDLMKQLKNARFKFKVDHRESVNEAQSGGKEEYQKFFNAALKKFKVKSPAELKGENKKKFYDYIDANWEGDNEKAEGAMSQVREFKMATMKSRLADIWGMKEGKNPFKKEEEEKEKPVITKGGKTLTGKKPAEIDVNPKIKA